MVLAALASGKISRTFRLAMVHDFLRKRLQEIAVKRWITNCR